MNLPRCVRNVPPCVRCGPLQLIASQDYYWIVRVRYGTTTLNETRYLSEAEHQVTFNYDCRLELSRSGRMESCMQL